MVINILKINFVLITQNNLIIRLVNDEEPNEEILNDIISN
jgi:hypothetical protein